MNRIETISAMAAAIRETRRRGWRGTDVELAEAALIAFEKAQGQRSAPFTEPTKSLWSKLASV